MKIKSLIFVATVAFGFSLSAAELTVSTPVRVDLTQATHHPVLSPDGNTVLFSRVDYKGLNALDLTTGEVKVIDESRTAGMEPRFSNDGSEVMYRTRVENGGVVENSVKSIRLNSGDIKQLVAPTTKAITAPAFGRRTYAESNFTEINVTVNGVTNAIKPIKDGYTYMWPSISPSKSKLLFKEAYSGVYVSNLDGTQARHLLYRGMFPCWVNDDFIVALVTKDDGYVVNEAKVVAIEVATGKTTTLTPDDVLVGGVTANANKIVYTTEDGKMYVMNVNITE